MRDNRLRGALFIVLFWVACSGGTLAEAQTDLLSGLEEPFPLRATDTSSPRDTLRSFLRDFSAFVDAWRSEKPRPEVLRPMLRAADAFDFTDVRILGRDATILINMALLREILDRVELPQYEKIPGDEEVAANDNLNHWVIPNTKIDIVRIDEGSKKGQFLFSKETVSELRNYYNLAKELPYKSGAIVGIYDEILASPGQWVPHQFPEMLPHWSTRVVGGQGIWQWIALALLAASSFCLFRALIRAGIRWDEANAERNPWRRFGTPIALIVVVSLARFVEAVAQNGIGLLELPLDLVSYTILAVQLLGAAWFAVSVSGRLAAALVNAGDRSRGRRNLDTALMRILFRLVSFTIIAMLTIVAAEEVGIPIAPLVAGIGLAVWRLLLRSGRPWKTSSAV